MSEKLEENSADLASGASSWPTNLLKNVNNNDTDPIQATHPAVVAVCNVLMFDGPLDYKAWHCPAEHVRTRETMEQCISHLILQRRPSATPEWIEKLPEVSRRIEKNLYFSARSIDDYSDPYTLVNRIQELVKVLITSAATLPIPAPGTAAAEAFSTINKALKGGEEEGSQEEVSSESSSGLQKEEGAAPGGASTTEGGVTVPTGLAQLVGAAKVDLCTVPLYLVPLKEAELAQQQATAALRLGVGLPPAPVVAPSNQVSSQGCSRVFIIKVLISVSEFVKGKSLPSIFTFKRELVMEWLIAAKQACCLPTYMAEEGYYGGPPFVAPDPSTHWSEPHQLYTWWKNNVERRSKFKVLQEDAKFKGLDPRRLQRARWCEAVVALSELIRASSGSSNVSRNGIQTTSGGNGLHSSVASQMAHVPNPLTNSAAYIQALTASLNQNNLRYEDSAAEGTGNNNYYTHSMTLPSFAQIHLATTTDDDRSGIDALMSMSSFTGGGYGHNDPAATSAAESADVEVPVSIKTEYPSVSQALLSPSPAHAHAVIAPSRGLDQPLPPHHLSPGLPGPPSHLANPSLTSPLIAGNMNMNMNMNTGLAKPPQLPLLSSFIPPANNLIIGTHIIPGTNIPYRNYSNTFPVKLFDLVSSEDETIVGWQGHGTSFQVRDMEKFVNLVLPKHFKHNNFTSFQRQLNLYGFRRSASYDKGAYYHPQFQQGQRELAESIRRVLAPGSEGSGGTGGANSGSNSASALAMSYLSSLPPGATVQLPGVASASVPTTSGAGIVGGKGATNVGNGKSYSVQELTGGDAAAESLLSMGAPITSMLSSNGLIPPLSNTSNGNTAAISVSDAAAGYGFGGTFNMMSRLHQQHQHQQVLLQQQQQQQQQQQLSGAKRAKLSAKDRKLLDMQQLGYNAEQFLASTTLSDRYTLGNSTSLLAVPQHHHHHHHSHGHAHSVSGTGGDTTKGNAGGNNSSGSGRGRGRPAKKAKHSSGTNGNHSSDEEEQEEDHEATYQDAVDGKRKSISATANTNSNSKCKSQPSRRALTAAGFDSNNDDADSVSSASVVPSKQHSAKRSSHSGSRSASYRDLTTLDAFGKSGLSRNSDISHLTRGAEEDLIDLRNPHSRRVYLDFTLLSHTTHNDNSTTSNTIEEGLDYISGVYRGKLTQGNKDVSLHYQLHGSRVLPEALLRLANQRDDDNLNDSSSAGGSPAQSVSSFIAAQNKDNLPKATRVGKNYQCALPVFSSNRGDIATNVFPGSVPVWVPNALSDECVNDFLSFLHERKRLVSLPVGSVLVVHLPEEKAYRLCCVLEVSTSSADAADTIISKVSSSDGASATTMVRVFDGYEDWRVPIGQCRTFREGEIELALQLLAKHHGQITPELTQEVDGLLRTGACSEGRISSLHLGTNASNGTNGSNGATVPWSAEEVQTFCNAVKRYGDNIKKVWSLRFASAGLRSLDELQEFFLTIYPHTQLGGAKRVVCVFARGQMAAAGRPNEEEGDGAGGSESNDDEEEVEGEGSGSESDSSRSSSNSTSNSNSDCESGAEQGDEEEEEGDARKVDKSKAVEATAAPPSSGPSSGTSVAAAAAAAVGVVSTPSLGSVAEPLAGAGRKRGSVEDAKGGLSESVAVESSAAAAAAKRRRR